MPLTGRGLWLLAFSLVAGVGAWLLGIADMWILAAGCLSAVVGALIYVQFRRLRLETTRIVTPSRVPAGGSARIQVSITNKAAARTPVVTLSDPWDDGVRVAEFKLAPLAGNEQVRATYRIPTEERGLFALGPLSVTVTDPLGLARRNSVVGETTNLTVFPPTVELRAPQDRRGADHHHGLLSQPAVGPAGESFHSLRPYVIGDDLRRIHWRTSARTLDLQVRQDELPWRGRCTVAVDGRADSHDHDTFELAMSVTASVLRAAISSGLDVRLIQTDGTDVKASGDTAQMDVLFEHLALAEPDRGTAKELLAALGHSEILMVTTSRGLKDDLLVPAVATAGLSGVAVAVGAEAALAPPTAAGLPVLSVRRLTDLPMAWNRYLGDVTSQA